MANKVLCRTFLKEALGDRDDPGLMLLISPELKPKAETIVKELDLKIKIRPCGGFPTGYWVIF